ncbi:hypothetical protein BAUCODRAFT_147644 [Baudoinia panamericana UAMH 10762]|uniref:F-box domain-containing protein n=1 Tax=Baudoinia panamericana (strain UAMH 10762) TaxID=717646 RepID=M2N0Y2_BAUPA|nr:uncharacterized protein BAUCODRAFT_147644 [Baudoinia panamericana UAMH 10762]EMC97583.1 hypothetical protein BAUCODRAFT_147644 [Baudoinia panamericana UAMH 10762]
MEANFGALTDDFEDLFTCHTALPFQDYPSEFEDVFANTASSTFDLFHLPPELWLRICHFAVLAPGPINLSSHDTSTENALVVQQPAVTRTCRLLRKEALPMFYRLNKFEARWLCHHECPRNWLLAIGRHRLEMMSTLTMYTAQAAEAWRGGFERMGIPVDIKVESHQVWNWCPWHRRKRRVPTLTISFLSEDKVESESTAEDSDDGGLSLFDQSMEAYRDASAED